MADETQRNDMLWAARLIGGLTRVNRVFAILCGIALLVTVVLILIDVLLRHFGNGGFSGSDEIAGYVMAGVASWGFSYALTERAHVRIDVLQSQLPRSVQGGLDLIAVASVAGVACVVTFYAWGVLEQSLANDSLANTALATPLWIPQSIWFAAWVWLSIVSVVLTLCVAMLLLTGAWRSVRDAAGPMTENGE